MILIPNLEIMTSTALLLIKVVVDSLTCYKKQPRPGLFDLCWYVVSLAGGSS